MISSIRRTIAAALALACCLGAAILPSRAASTAITYDTTTKLVVMPTAFWTSNVVAATGYTPTNSAGRLALILDANLLDLVDGSLTGSKVGSGINGDNITTGTVADARIDSALARDTELTAAIAALSTVYQPLDADLTDLADGSLSGSKVGSGISADNITTGTVADARIAATIARLASPALTGTPTVNGTNFMALIASGGGGGGSGNADTNNSTAWANSTSVSLYDLAIRGTATIANLSIGSASYSGIWGFANGGHGATNAAGARTALGLEKDVDVQTFRLPLLQLYVALGADGDMPYRNSSGIVTNLTSTSAGRTLLTAANAAAQRSSMGVPALAGDTYTGPVLVPYVPYSANWTNLGTNYVPTMRAVAEKIETLSLGGYIASVASDFQVSGSQLSVTNTTGTGPILRQSAAGTNAVPAWVQSASVSGATVTDYMRYNGSNWANAPWPSPLMESDTYEECFTAFNGGLSQSLPYIATAINSGTVAITANRRGRSGVALVKTATTASLWTGNGYAGIASGCILTNKYSGKTEYLFCQTNGVEMKFGWMDNPTTNAATVGLLVTGTNGVLRLAAGCNSAWVNGASTHVVNTNFWYSFWILGTNQTASVLAFTNGVPAWSDTITATNIPAGTGLAFNFGVATYINAGGASLTNGAEIGVINTLGYRLPTQLQ